MYYDQEKQALRDSTLPYGTFYIVTLSTVSYQKFYLYKDKKRFILVTLKEAEFEGCRRQS